MKPHLSTSSSKVYLRRFLAFFLVLAAVYALFFGAVRLLLTWMDDRNSSQKISKYQLEDFYALPQNSLDVLILGSSHAMCTYDPFWIQQNTGLSAYNLGTALQQPDTSFFLLKEVLKTQKPKYILYDIYFKVMQEGFGAEQATTVLKEMKPSKNAWSFYLKNLDFDTKLSYYNTWISPFGRLQSILANSGGRQSEPRTPFYIGRGFYSTTGIVDAALLTDEKHPFSNEYKPFDPRQVEYVKALCALARENGIEVRFVSAPIPPTIYDYISYNDEITRDTKALAESVDVTFRDFNADVKSGALPLVDTDFADQGHLNQAGNKKFCDFLLTVIKK